MDHTIQIPTFANAWLFPIRTRIDMITTGIRTPVGIKVLGPDLNMIEKIGLQLEKVLQPIAGTRSAFFERVTGGYYLDFQVRREEAARYGLSVGEIQDVIESAIGGATVTTTVEGRERYPVNVRYSRDFRTDIPNLNRVLVSTPAGAQVPITQLTEITLRTGPSMIKNEEGFPAGFVYVDVTGRDMGRYVEEAKQVVAQNVQLPAGYHLVWSGQYEYLQRVVERLWVVVPITWSTGAGSDVMRRIAAPMIGGIFTSFILELVVYPAIYEIWKGREVRKLAEAGPSNV